MRNIIIAFILFVSVFANAQSRVGLVHPRVLGQPTDTTKFGVILLDTVTNAGNWFELNETDFIVEGGVVGLRFQTDSVFVLGDSLCAITNGDTLCVFQDSVFITNDSFCIIQMGDTTCVQFMGGFGPTLYTGDDTISSSRILTVPSGTTMLFRRIDSGGTSDIFKIESSATSSNSLTLGLNSSATNKPVVTIKNSAGAGNVYQKFENAVLTNYNIGIDRASGLFNITEGGFITTGQFMQFSSAGDSVIVNRDIQIDAGLLDASGDIGTSGQVLVATGTGINWEAQTGGAAISDLTVATATNTINNDAYKQEWQWDGLAGSTGLKLSAATTAAIGSTQKLFEVALSGVNATAAQTTYAGHFSNTHTGTSSINYGIRGIATGAIINYGVHGSVATGIGVQGTSSTSGTGVNGTSASGAGVAGSSSTGVAGSFASSSSFGIQASSDGTQAPGYFYSNNATSSGVTNILSLHHNTTGTPAAGIGVALSFGSETAAGSFTNVWSNRIISTYTDVGIGTETSSLSFVGKYNGANTFPLFLDGNGVSRFNGRAEMQQGADVASVAGAITLGYDGNVFEITGTNAITLISNLGFQNGTEVTLIFTSTATLTDGTANSGTDIGMELAGNTNFSGSADDSVTLVLSEIGGTQRWREKCRSIN